MLNDISPDPIQKQIVTILTGENADAFTFGLNDDAFTFNLLPGLFGVGEILLLSGTAAAAGAVALDPLGVEV